MSVPLKTIAIKMKTDKKLVKAVTLASFNIATILFKVF